MFYSRASEALFLFIRLLLAGYVAFETYPSKPAAREIIKKCGIIKRFNSESAHPQSHSAVRQSPRNHGSNQASSH